MFVFVRCAAYLPWASRPVMFCGQSIHKTVYGKMEEKERIICGSRTFGIWSAFPGKCYRQYLLTTVLLTVCQASYAAGKFVAHRFVTGYFQYKSKL